MMTKPNSHNDRFAVLLDGPVVPTARLKRQIHGRRMIAADGGIRHARTLDVAPMLWVGDFDSADAELVDEWSHVPRLEFPTQKAASDGALALAQAVKAGGRDILLCGAVGGARSDHAMFNLAQLAGLSGPEVEVWASNGSQEQHCLPTGRAVSFDFEPGSVFSVFGFGDLRGLTIEGARWPLDKVDVPFGSTLTLSNVVHAPLRINLDDGRALLFVLHEPGA